MKYTLQYLALASVASARVLHTRQSSCCFGINVSGDGVEGGSLGQISDGQNRFGPGQSGASYCINNGQITDKKGRGCVITGPTDQFQCDQGASPTEGFSITSSGQVEFNGDDQFYACPSDDNGNYNIYTKPVENMPKCVKVSLSSADGTCAAPSSAPASSAPPATTAVSVSTATQAPSLSPRLIIPVDSNNPDTAYGTQYNAYIGNGNSTIFDFDIPQSYKGKQCELVFTFPTQSQLETSFVSESGNGGVEFKQLKEAADEKTTFNTQPGVTKNFGEKGVSTGNAYSITTGDCAVGQTISYELTATGDKTIEFFQDYNPCPIGLWVIAN
ncbi:hypothetical protein M438DRAFT_281317 [Aureobasidium pullulans EXF-150]|uniref:Uncharacterized protein n=1 Tax=Aureobasidium pullulans EXF-150 TaxID=1043002 RepID=A0A074Y0W4_AURPU|nr:uncharacterized protein M438DRAFT_281317 [Aureobasidium pullulans EXF-150]KEQ80536.1 hypothetical protein M438DRAFT_281317 [Aureobasidium pullulans EXF-150]